MRMFSKKLFDSERDEWFKFRKAPYDNDAVELKSFARMMTSKFLKRSVHAGSGTNPRSAMQRCTIKARYGTTVEGHKKFLTVYMPQQNKKNILEKPELFGEEKASSEAFLGYARDGTVAAYEANLSARHYKFIISPENRNIDLRALATTVMKSMNKLFGRAFLWQAVEHHDTAHPHVHLLINGVDARGKEVTKFPAYFIKSGMRDMAQHICTGMVGARTPEDIRAAEEKTVSAHRYTNIDRQLELYETPYRDAQNSEIVSRIATYNFLKTPGSNEQKYARLNYLCKLGLAELRDERYCMKKGWTETLKHIGRYNTYLEVRRDYGLKKPVVLFEKQSPPVTGIIKKIYTMDDEEVWNNACVLETNTAVYYVPSYFKVSAHLLGRRVTIQNKQMRNGTVQPAIALQRE